MLAGNVALRVDGERADHVRQVIDWLDKELKITAYDLPVGAPNDAGQCPLARIIQLDLGKEASVRHSSIVIRDFNIAGAVELREITLPQIITDWLKDFDGGKYPEYEEVK